MPELPGFMSEIAARVHGKLSNNMAPHAADGSSTTGYDTTAGNIDNPGTKPKGHKKLPAKAGVTNVPHAEGGNSKANQIPHRTRGHK